MEPTQNTTFEVPENMEISTPTIIEGEQKPNESIKPELIRPSVSEVQQKFDTTLKGTRHYLPITNNKGEAGQLSEILLGIPLSSECLDCCDGEIKLFPLKRLKRKKAGEWTPKESIAITTSGIHTPEAIPWDESYLQKKISNVLFISYYRDGENNDYINYMSSYVLNSSNCNLYDNFKADYEKITTYYRTNGVNQTPKISRTENDISNTINGTYIQGRTKGPGGNKKKTVAFYFITKNFVKNVLLKQYMKL